MMLVIIAILIVLGLCAGSFVNALVWRVHQQAKSKNKQDDKLSILRGRSMCTHCHHELHAFDLIPVLSWLSLKGKCRYCHKRISIQYPLVELATAILFFLSYIWWPAEISGTQIVAFGLWLVLLTGLMALLVYDLKWKLLPNRIMTPLYPIAALYACLEAASSDNIGLAVLNVVLALAVGGGIFYVLFQVSNGKWIGGGDVKLGWLLGLVAGTPARSLLIIFLAALIGTAASLPLLGTQRLKRNSTIPFGPFLILAAIIVQLFGHNILHWYRYTILGGY